MYIKKWKKLLNIILTTSLIVSMALPTIAVKAEAPSLANDLIISEYIEGSSNNKAVEIYNGTTTTIDLNDYKIELYVNGKTTIQNTHNLTGNLNPGETIIFHHASSSEDLKAMGGTVASITNFNGDDTLLLKKGEVIIDSFGQLGYQPNKAWTVNGVSTADQTLVRKSSITKGDTNPNDEFDPSLEWISFPIDTFSNLGSHVMNGIDEGTGDNESKVAVVISSIPSGIVSAGTTVTLQSATEGATIYYTTDGKEPTTESVKYIEPIKITTTTTLKAIAVVEGSKQSEVTTLTYEVISDADILSMEEARSTDIGETVIIKGIVAGLLKNTISVQDATGGIAVRPATLDVQVGEEVTLMGTLADYKGLLQLDKATIISKGDKNNTLTPKEVTTVGETEESQLVTVENVSLTLASSGSGWANYTATDSEGNTFLVRDENGTLGLLENVNYEKITGIVQQFDQDYQVIPRGVVDVVLDSTSLRPAIASPESGVFVGAQQITLTTTTKDASIYYTFDGSEPTAQSTKYTQPITIKETTTLKAVVQSNNGILSEVSTFNYKITESLQIHDIQGESHYSPLAGQTVKDIVGIVTYTYKIGSGNYFHMQTPDELIDNNPKTSEAIVVYTGNQSTVSIGNLVKVSGKVDEYQIDGYTDTKKDTDLPVTQINARTDQGGLVTVTEESVPLPKPIFIDEKNLPSNVIDNDNLQIFDPEEDAIDFWESLEGMLVEVGTVKAVAPQDNGDLVTVLESRETNTIHGGIKLEANTVNADFIQFKLYDNTAARKFEVATGDKFVGPIVGVVNYGYQNYKIYADLDYMKAKYQKGDVKPEETKIKYNDKKLTIASYNLENFSNNTKQTTNDKAKKLARAFVQDMKSPDIIGVTEVQDNNGSDAGDSKADQSYKRLISAIKTAGGPTYQYLNIDPVNNADGGAPDANIRVGFLYNPERVSLPEGLNSGDATTAVGYEDGKLTLNPGRIDPTNKVFNSSRKPLAAQFTFQGEDIIVIANHWNSKTGDTPLFGSVQPPVYKSEIQRKQIAQIVANFIEDIKTKNSNANIVSLGDFNDYQFSDALKIHEGKNMTNMINKVEDADRYSYVFQGHSQVLDHILVSNNLVNKTVIDILHINADFTDMAGRASDHDPVMVQIDLFKKAEVTSMESYTFNNFKTDKLTITKPNTYLSLNATSKITDGILINSNYSEIFGGGFKNNIITFKPTKPNAIIDLKGTKVQKIIIDGTNVKEIRGIFEGQIFEFINGASADQIIMTDVSGDLINSDPSLPTENNPPVINSEITKQTATFGKTFSLDLAEFFSDPDDDQLSFKSSKGTISGSILTLSLEEGKHTIELTVSDGMASISTTFLVEFIVVSTDNYYTGAFDLTGQPLKQKLHEIIADHKKLSYSTAWEALRETDEDPNNQSNVILFYSGKSISKASNGGNVGNWNREHVWAKSHGNFGTSIGPGTDIHNLRPTDVTVNSIRGNLDFDFGGTEVKNCSQCKKDTDSFEPPDEVKGDVARILFYMATRYESDDIVDLELNDYVNNGSAPYHGKLSVLLQWHKQDPVSEFEKNRNDVIYEWQGNRNPFIDYPEWVEEIWN